MLVDCIKGDCPYTGYLDLSNLTEPCISSFILRKKNNWTKHLFTGTYSCTRDLRQKMCWEKDTGEILTHGYTWRHWKRREIRRNFRTKETNKKKLVWTISLSVTPHLPIFVELWHGEYSINVKLLLVGELNLCMQEEKFKGRVIS